MTDGRALTCRDVVELVTQYIEGDLSHDDRARFEAHMRGCSWCARYIEQMRTSIAVTGTLREDDLSPTMRETLIAAFRDWKSSTP